MLDTGSPLTEEEANQSSVSPLNSRHVSRSSSPGISTLDGTPRYLFPFSTAPPTRVASPSPTPMARKASPVPRSGQQDHTAVGAASQRRERGTQVSPVDLPEEPLPDHGAALGSEPMSVPNLCELSCSLRMAKYQTGRSNHVQSRLFRRQVTIARAGRLIKASHSVQRTLAECIRSEDKLSFVNLFNAFHDALSFCSALPWTLDEDDWTDESCANGYPNSFLDALPLASRSTILDFLSKVRHDGHFIADRLTALAHQELIALLPERGPSRSSDSILSSSTRTSSRTSRHLGFVVDGQTDLLASYGFGSVLETLVHSIRGLSAGDLQDDPMATDVWSTVCARLIVEKKPGSERLVPVILDLWASCPTWSGKGRLELWILETLQAGSFILEQPSKHSFRMRVQGKHEPAAEDDLRQETFYAQAVDSLLDLLGDPKGPSVIPNGARTMCRAILGKLHLSPAHQQAFPNFVITRWLLTSFLPEAVTLPEIHGVATDHFISENARHSILREIASRVQKTVFDTIYSWKLGSVASPEVIARVEAIVGQFRSVSETQMGSQQNVSPATNCTSEKSVSETFVAVSMDDVSTVVNALYPQRRRPSLPNGLDPLHSGLRSSSSSVSGFSLFKSEAQPELAVESMLHLPQPDSQGLSAIPLSEKSNQESFATPHDSTLKLDFDGENLREASSAIQDFVSTDYQTDMDKWVMLVADPTGRILCSMQQKLSESSQLSLVPGSETADVVAKGHSSEYRTCKAAVEELLFSDELFAASKPTPGVQDNNELHEIYSKLSTALKSRIVDAEEQSDFLSAHAWSCNWRLLQSFVEQEHGFDCLLNILNDIKSEAQQSLDVCSAVVDCSEGWNRLLGRHFDDLHLVLHVIGETVGKLRGKMWYVADVRTSAAYDEARSITSALRVMGKPKKLARARLVQPLRHWSGHKLSSTSLHLKTEAQILDLLSVAPDRGGPNKLSDDQSKALAAWMERNTVENLCRGEERLHKLCMEVRKCIDQTIGKASSDGSTLWSNPLFSRGRPPTTAEGPTHPTSSLSSLQGNTGRLDWINLHASKPSSVDAMSNTSYPLSTRSSRDCLEARSPTLTNRSSIAFWSPAVTEAQSPSSATSVGSSHTPAVLRLPIRQRVKRLKNSESGLIEQLRVHLTSLLLSDLASTLFSEGSETDRSFWTGLGGELSERHLRSHAFRAMPHASSTRTCATGFNFERAFTKSLRRFAASSNPYVKLDHLHELDTLLAYYSKEVPPAPSSGGDLRTNLLPTPNIKSRATSPGADVKVDGFRMLFSSRTLRPASLFRDLQYIAALIPSQTLETTPQGKSFWNAAIATSQLKQEIRNIMVETADGIISYHANNRGHASSSSTAQQRRDHATFSTPSRTPSAEDISRFSMADAAYLLQITAKEGDAVAQRELGTLYLTHPELMEPIIAPLVRPRDVFREELESKWRKNQDPARCDPVTMCIAHHWMTLSSKGGDKLAKEYLKQREEMDRLP